jgi:UDP-N-acetylmuramyl pentapeptide phosphotransferase/UDP-N-acetylglucosamine-1-phosphate transferase
MIFETILLLSTIIIFFINKVFKVKNILVNFTGELHQKFASHEKIPLTGGFLIILNFSFLTENQNIILIFLLAIFILGLISDLKFLRSATKRFIVQTLIVLTFVITYDLQLQNTKIIILDKILTSNFFNYLFVSFCILIVINGSNFLDGLNTLTIGYFLLIFCIIFYIENKNYIVIDILSIDKIIYVLVIVFLLNFFNQLYLGDSGSYLLGFFTSIILLDIYEINSNISPFFIILLLWYPCFETLFSILRKNIMNKSPLNPDINHLHQIIFYWIKIRFKLGKLNANLISGLFINFYNFIIFILSINFISNSQIQILIIMFNIILYIFLYFKLFVNRVK